VETDDLLCHIFEIKTEAQFTAVALEVFRFQYEHMPVYRSFVDLMKVKVDEVNSLEKIPFLPIEFFKSHEISYKPQTTNHKLFTSSGTTGEQLSKHYVTDISVYKKSFRKGFEYFYGNIEEFCILALLPTYLERENSSLIFMTDDLIKQTKNPDSGFYQHNTSELIQKLNILENKKQKTILLGVTYALLDLIPHLSKLQTPNPKLVIMETGGMKGKRKEMVREELHKILCEGFGVQKIHSEYGMTELFSQAYSYGNGIFNCVPWMKILIRDVNDAKNFLPAEKTGGINVIDLANIYSCSFIATQDLGKFFPNNSFEVLGRFDNSDLRGCNLLV